MNAMSEFFFFVVNAKIAAFESTFFSFWCANGRGK